MWWSTKRSIPKLSHIIDIIICHGYQQICSEDEPVIGSNVPFVPLLSVVGLPRGWTQALITQRVHELIIQIL